jgi:aspartyl-tRNA(Asn)/glutamyl-tRNA(Gln) amidotransferase subunit B
VLGEFSAALNQHNVTFQACPVNAERLASLLLRIDDGTISAKSGKEVFQELWACEKSVDEIVEDKGLQQMSDTGELENIIEQIIEQSPQQVEQYRSGKDKVFGYFVGKVMKETKGKANPKQVNEILKLKLS